MFCHKHSDSGKRPLLGNLRGVLYILFIHIPNAGYFWSIRPYRVHIKWNVTAIFTGQL